LRKDLDKTHNTEIQSERYKHQYEEMIEKYRNQQKQVEGLTA